MILKLNVAMDQINPKNICFRVFCKFVTSVLMLRPPNTYIFGFQELFGFCTFEMNSWLFSNLWFCSFSSKQNYE